MTKLLRVLLPIGLIVVGSLLAAALIAGREKPAARAPEAARPLVRFERIELQDLQLRVESQGTVSPRTESVLVPEVSGRVLEISPSLVAGGFFEEGDLLLRVDADDYRQAVVQSRAQVAQAELRLARERAEQQLAREEWADLGEGGAPPPLTGRELQVADAEAALEAARAALRRAERDLNRTSLRAPYAGRVRMKEVDLGQFVNRGTPIGSIYAIDYAEIRLPLPDDDLAFLDLPLVFRGDRAGEAGPEVILSARFAGSVHEWRGRIVRTEGEIDPRSRMVHAIAAVADPYGRADRRHTARPPLAVGLFVEAEILGEQLEGVAVIPRSAVRDDRRVLVLDADDRVRFRDVEIARRKGEQVYVRSGLADGERIVLSRLAAVTDGMQVRAVESDPETREENRS